MYRVLIVDDHPLYRSAMRSVLQGVIADVRVLESSDLASTKTCLREHPCDLVILDLVLPGVQGLEGVERVRAEAPDRPIIVCSAHEDPALVRSAFKLGVAGYLPKSSGAAIISHAINLVRDGGIYIPSEALREALATDNQPGGNASPVEIDESDSNKGLTPRQLNVLALLEEGMSNKAIARELGIGEITVKAHVSAILRKLGVSNRLQAVLSGRR